MLHNATWWEIAWTAPAIVALILRLWLLELVFGDMQYWKSEHERHPTRDVIPERTWAESQVWHKLALVSILFIMAAFGVLTILTPATTSARSPSRVTYALLGVFTLIPTILTADAIQTIVSRKRTERADDIRAARQRRRRGDRLPGVPGELP